MKVVFLIQLKSWQFLSHFIVIKIVHKGPKQLKLVLAPAAAELDPAQPQLVSSSFLMCFL